MANFKRIHTIYSKAAKDNNINNYPGVDTDLDPCLTETFVWSNIQSLYQNCIDPIVKTFGSDFIKLTSVYKSSKLERFLGGNPNSQHVWGYAADIISTKHPTSLIWNWCFENLPSWNQLIWEYPERGRFTQIDQDYSWIHISFVKENNPKITSISSKVEKIHKIYEGELTTRLGDYTHGITLADENSI